MKFRTSLFASALALCGACSNQVTYEDPEEIEVLTTGFSYSDLQAIAQEMTESFTGSNAWGGDKPRIVFGGVDNRTNQHIDTQNITDTIRTGVIELPTGAWYEPEDYADPSSLEVHGNPNVLTRDVGTSKLGQGPTAHSCLVEVELFDAPLPEIKSFSQPQELTE